MRFGHAFTAAPAMRAHRRQATDGAGKNACRVHQQEHTCVHVALHMHHTKAVYAALLRSCDTGSCCSGSWKRRSPAIASACCAWHDAPPVMPACPRTPVSMLALSRLAPPAASAGVAQGMQICRHQQCNTAAAPPSQTERATVAAQTCASHAMSRELHMDGRCASCWHAGGTRRQSYDTNAPGLRRHREPCWQTRGALRLRALGAGHTRMPWAVWAGVKASDEGVDYHRRLGTPLSPVMQESAPIDPRGRLATQFAD